MNVFSSALNKIKGSLKSIINTRFDNWLTKRVPSNSEFTLTTRNIFIMPTGFGFSYLFFVLLLFLLGTNYQNNTILLLSYLLGSLFIIVMMHSFYNFSGLTISSTTKQYIFANQTAFYPVNITANKSHFDLHIKFNKNSLVNQETLEQCEAGQNLISVPYFAPYRGVYKLGRTKFYSEYSLGFFITWAMLDFSHQLIVFPQPKKLKGGIKYLSSLDSEQYNKSTTANFTAGTDDFWELRNYITGEAQSKVAWKQLARGQGKLTKHYQSQQGSLHWLKLSDMPSLDIEIQLSYLCFLILEYSRNNYEFGLILDQKTLKNANHQSLKKIMPSSGYQHQQNCLIALAEYTNSEACG